MRGIHSQRRMAEHKRLNTFLLIALHMSRVLHPSFFLQVHTVNTHVFSIGARSYIHFKDISNTANVRSSPLAAYQKIYGIIHNRNHTFKVLKNAI